MENDLNNRKEIIVNYFNNNEKTWNKREILNPLECLEISKDQARYNSVVNYLIKQVCFWVLLPFVSP